VHLIIVYASEVVKQQAVKAYVRLTNFGERMEAADARSGGGFRVGDAKTEYPDRIHIVVARPSENLDLILADRPTGGRSPDRDIAGFVLGHEDHRVGAENEIRGNPVTLLD